MLCWERLTAGAAVPHDSRNTKHYGTTKVLWPSRPRLGLDTIKLRVHQRRNRFKNEARCNLLKNHKGWWACSDSNREPTDYESAALTVELQAPSRTRGVAVALSDLTEIDSPYGQPIITTARRAVTFSTTRDSDFTASPRDGLPCGKSAKPRKLQRIAKHRTAPLRARKFSVWMVFQSGYVPLAFPDEKNFSRWKATTPGLLLTRETPRWDYRHPVFQLKDIQQSRFF